MPKTEGLGIEQHIAIDSLETQIRLSIDQSRSGVKYRIPQVVDKQVTVEVGDVFRWGGITTIVKALQNNIYTRRADNWGENLEDGTIPVVQSVTPLITVEVVFTNTDEYEQKELLVVGRDFVLDTHYPNDYYKPDKTE